MEHDRTKGLADRFIGALQRFEREGGEALEPLLELFADDARLTNPALDLAGQARVGREETRRFWTTYREVLGEAESRFSHVTTSADAAGLFWTTRGSGTAGDEGNEGEPALEYAGATLLVFDERGRIAYLRGYFDPRELGAHASRRAEDAEGPVDLSTRKPVVGRPGVSYG